MINIAKYGTAKYGSVKYGNDPYQLIFDRVLTDVLNHTKKGYYNAEDLNRIEGKTQLIINKLVRLGYILQATIKNDWNMTDFPNPSQCDRILNNIALLLTVIPVGADTPELPVSMEKIDYLKANDIEKILYDIDRYMDYTMANWRYSGDVYAGEGYFSD